MSLWTLDSNTIVSFPGINDSRLSYTLTTFPEMALLMLTLESHRIGKSSERTLKAIAGRV